MKYKQKYNKIQLKHTLEDFNRKRMKSRNKVITDYKHCCYMHKR